MKINLFLITFLIGLLNTNLANAEESNTYMGLAIGSGFANFTARYGVNYNNEHAIEFSYINLNDHGDYDHSDFYIISYKPYFPISDSSKFSLSIGAGLFSRQDFDDFNNDESGIAIFFNAGYELAINKSTNITAEIASGLRFGINFNF